MTKNIEIIKGKLKLKHVALIMVISFYYSKVFKTITIIYFLLIIFFIINNDWVTASLLLGLIIFINIYRIVFYYLGNKLISKNAEFEVYLKVDEIETAQLSYRRLIKLKDIRSVKFINKLVVIDIPTGNFYIHVDTQDQVDQIKAYFIRNDITLLSKWK